MIKQKIEQIIHDAAKDLGYGIYEYSIYLKGENSKISVKIDSLSGISHKDCERYGKELGWRLDEDNILPNYSLEISSPGLDRKLELREDYVRFQGAPVKIIYEQDGVRKVLKGRILEAGEDSVRIESEQQKEELVPFKDIITTNLDY